MQFSPLAGLVLHMGTFGPDVFFDPFSGFERRLTKVKNESADVSLLPGRLCCINGRIEDV
jgi:hypothetical protein